MQPTRHNLDTAQLWRLPTCACSTQMVSCGNLSALKTSVNLKPESLGNRFRICSFCRMAELCVHSESEAVLALESGGHLSLAPSCAV